MKTRHIISIFIIYFKLFDPWGFGVLGFWMNLGTGPLAHWDHNQLLGEHVTKHRTLNLNKPNVLLPPDVDSFVVFS